MNSVQFGTIVEQLFAAECATRKIAILRPASPVAHDFSIQAPGRVIKVQVKGTSALVSAKCGLSYRFRCYRNTRPPKGYKESGVDFIAAYIFPLQRWHIFPAPDGLRKIHIHPSPVGMHLENVDRWDLIGGEKRPMRKLGSGVELG